MTNLLLTKGSLQCILVMLILLVGCSEEASTEPSQEPEDVYDCIGVKDGLFLDIDEDGFTDEEGLYCLDLKFFQDVIDENNIIINSPLNLGTQGWSSGGRLISLSLTGISQLSTIPESIGNLTALSNTLDLSSNSISYIPESIENLVNITGLGIHNNQLSYLPETICNLNVAANLNVWNNKLCDEFHDFVYSCITEGDFLSSSQDQSHCCEGVNEEGVLVPNWTHCE